MSFSGSNQEIVETSELKGTAALDKISRMKQSRDSRNFLLQDSVLAGRAGGSNQEIVETVFDSVRGLLEGYTSRSNQEIVETDVVLALKPKAFLMERSNQEIVETLPRWKRTSVGTEVTRSNQEIVETGTTRSPRRAWPARRPEAIKR